jgi:hypothetical protein
MRTMEITLLATLAFGCASAAAAPWKETPEHVSTIDIKPEFDRMLVATGAVDERGVYKNYQRPFKATMHLNLCAHPDGEKGTASYRHVVTAALSKEANTKKQCRAFRVRLEHHEGAGRSYYLSIDSHGKEIRAKKIHLLSDGFRWFLMAADSYGDEQWWYEAAVLPIGIYDAADTAPVIGAYLWPRCTGMVTIPREFEDFLWEVQGRELADYRGDGGCNPKRPLESGLEMVNWIRWSPRNHHCYIDFAKCMN